MIKAKINTTKHKLQFEENIVFLINDNTFTRKPTIVNETN